jgi:hypothetical protein
MEPRPSLPGKERLIETQQRDGWRDIASAIPQTTNPMESEPSKVRSLAIESTMAQFDFTKVSAAAAAVGWNVSTRPSHPGAVPTIDEMKQISRELLEKAWDDEEAPNCEYCHGGMRASRTDGCLTLQFVLEEAYFVAAIDAVDK